MAHAFAGHPERPERLAAVMERLQTSGLGDDVTLIESHEVEADDLAKVHTPRLIDDLVANERDDAIVRIDQDTYLSPGSNRAARLACGAAAEGVRAILRDDTQRVFCAVRPPGHHAEVNTAMGFCLFNTVAIAAAVALESPDIERVAILDFDVHQGNGTVDIFKDDSRVLVASSFQDNFYPMRYMDYANSHVVPCPLSAGSGSREFRRAIEDSWLPALARHQPDLILISAGFDGHRDDPLGGLRLETEDYRWITRLIREQADHYCRGRVLSTLEGGYDLTALSDSVEAHLSELMN
ncbi:MAG: histone deacetylase family protein [Pseudomonadota bacterium]